MSDPHPGTFLVIDDNTDSRFLLVKTLLRKFPGSVIHECHSADKAIEIARRKILSAIVTHRTTEMAGLSVLRQLREVAAATPIVMVSSIDRRDAAIAAGASDFLLYDEWLRIGTLVSELIAKSAPPLSGSVGSNPPVAPAEPAGAAE